ncbi:MAG: CorA family divalent cation transporter [Acutalibacter sp.]|jgi:magnesium transporter
MRYQLKPAWQVLEGPPSPDKPWVELLSHKELMEQMSALNAPFLERSLRHSHNCKAELLEHCAAGTLLIPHKERLLNPGTSFAFCLTEDCLYFGDDTGEVEKLLQRLSQQPGLESQPSGLLLEFLELLIQEDATFLQRLESHLDELEEQLLAQKESPHFENQLHRYRRGLLKLSAYYSQLEELGDTLASNRNNLFPKKICRGFELFSRRASRLHSQTASLREYSLQLHQIYQSKIDLKQNRVMQFLTVVTTIFLPLTLITGWYGMNFTHMPELSLPFAYPAIILLSAGILLAEILFFRRKHW